MPHDASDAALGGSAWADTKHDGCRRVRGTDPAAYGGMGHLPDAIDHWARALAARCPGRKIAVCLEPSKGSLRAALLKDNHVVLYPITPRLLAKCREAFAPSGQQAEPTEAPLLRERVRKHREQRKPWRPADDHTRTRQGFVEPRRTLVNDKTRLTNRLTRVRNGSFPHVLCGFAALDTPFLRDGLRRWPTLQAVQAADDATWRTFFPAPHAHHRPITPPRLVGMRQAIPATTDQAVLRASAMRVPALVEPVGCVTAAIARFDNAIGALTRSHADVPMVASWPGAGPVHASRLISARGRDRRWDDPVEAWLPFTGMAPVIERRGHMTVTPFRWFCPPFLRQAFHACAGQSIQHARWAKALYPPPRRRGKTHHASVRSLACKWASMSFRLWNTRRPDHEQLDGAA
jgi:hypothetical protein